MSLVSDVTHQVKHPPTCTIHSPFTGGLKLKCFFLVCANEEMLYMHLCHPVRQAVVHLVVEVWREEGLRTECSTGNVVESCTTC